MVRKPWSVNHGPSFYPSVFMYSWWDKQRNPAWLRHTANELHPETVEAASKRGAGDAGRTDGTGPLARTVQQFRLNFVGRRQPPTLCDSVAEAFRHHGTVRGGPPRGHDELFWCLAEFVVGHLVS